MSIALSVIVILAAGALAFAVTKALGVRFGMITVALAAALWVPFLLAYVRLYFPAVPPELEAYLPPADASFAAGGYMALGAASFAGLTILSAIIGVVLGRRLGRSQPS